MAPLMLEITVYVLLGFVLLLSNVPPLVAILWDRELRIRYAVLAALLFPCCVNGGHCIGQAILRIFATTTHRTPIARSAIFCLTKIEDMSLWQTRRKIHVSLRLTTRSRHLNETFLQELFAIKL
uniref:G_PROTEIN_RECEP_F1_2 domain-containing protein n=1 Tax=Ascaris lumbricoides TaxID=6252 RepID=A0A0M3I5J5_ASCLU